MCILKYILHQCPETEESREVKQNNPNDIIFDIPRGSGKTKLCREIGHLEACVELEAEEEHHMQQVRVYCAHPYIGNCGQPTGKVVEIVQGMCADCLGVSRTLPRRAWLRQEQQLPGEFTEGNQERVERLLAKEAKDTGWTNIPQDKDNQNDGGEDGAAKPVLRGAPYTDVHPDLFRYFQQVVILLKHSVARRIPEANMSSEGLEEVRMQIRAERFCRCWDDHWMDDAELGAAERMELLCSCAWQVNPSCANVGRALRMDEAKRILEHHSRMVRLLEARCTQTDSRQLQDQRAAARGFFLNRRAGPANVDQIAVFDMYPSEQARFNNAMLTLNSEVKDKMREVRRDQVWIETHAGWSDFERQLRMRAIVAAPAVAWIALDNGLKDEVAEELVNIATTWFLYAGTPFDKVMDGSLGKTAQQRAVEQAVYNDIKRMFSVLTQMFPANDPQQWQLFQRNFVDGGTGVEGRSWDMEVRRTVQDRDTRYANAIRKLPDALDAARKRVWRRQNNNPAAAMDEDEPTTCSICYDPFDDNVEMRRMVRACPQSDLHLTCLGCTVRHMLRDPPVNPRTDDSLPRCPECRTPCNGRFFRVLYDDLGTLAPPSAEDAADAIRVALAYPPDNAVEPRKPFLW